MNKLYIDEFYKKLDMVENAPPKLPPIYEIYNRHIVPSYQPISGIIKIVNQKEETN